MKLLIFIPARSGSKGIKNKNMVDLNRNQFIAAVDAVLRGEGGNLSSSSGYRHHQNNQFEFLVMNDIVVFQKQVLIKIFYF